MGEKIKIIQVGKWSVAYHRPTENTLLQFEWQDLEPLNFAMTAKQAVEMAKAILAQYEMKPPAPLIIK